MNSRPPHGNDDFEFEEDPPPEALSGNVSTGESRELDEALLGLIAATTQVYILLIESDVDEFSRVRPRLEAFRSIVAQLPVNPQRPSKTLGFRLQTANPLKSQSRKRAPSRRNRRK